MKYCEMFVNTYYIIYFVRDFLQGLTQMVNIFFNNLQYVLYKKNYNLIYRYLLPINNN